MTVLHAGLLLLLSLISSGGSYDRRGRPRQPNIVTIVVDDLGWGDINSFTGGEGQIPTPKLDKLAAWGLKLEANYVQPTCTPSRAALMTGRYAHNAALTFAIFTASPAGLPRHLATLPQLMRRAGYRAHMVGKWHLGYAHWSQTPVGRGFESHVGSLHGIIEYYTKNMWRHPTNWGGKDWGVYHQNKTYTHFQETRHATVAQTQEAILRMQEHVQENAKRREEERKPLFLYLAYNAPHTPYACEESWKGRCGHIKHEWRRNHCCMVAGLDTHVPEVVVAARRILGSNTVVVFTSDNGGSVWEGGLNTPLRQAGGIM